MIYYIRNSIDDLIGFKYNENIYYYDSETNLYYLNNRYYRPMLKRFLNADNIFGANQDIRPILIETICNLML